MSRIIAALCALVAALTIGPAFAAPAHADPTHPVRILVFGDSLTLSRHGMYSWRYRLDKEMRRQGVPFDFVGSLSAPHPDPGYAPSRYLDPNFDQGHFCKSGWKLHWAINGPLGDEVRKQDPDVVVLELGTADVVYGDSPQATRDWMRTAVTQMRAVKPTVRFVLPEVLTRVRPDPTINQRTLAYNQLLRQLATEMDTPESPVHLAGVMAGWSPTKIMTMDGSHLSPTGETFYAQRIAEELHAEGILPQKPAVYHGYLPWTRTVPITVRAAAGRIDVSWSRETVSTGQVRWRPVGATAWRTTATYAGGKASIPVPAGGTYDVQQQIRWYDLTGPFGATTRVRVPALSRQSAPTRVVVTRAGVRWPASRGARTYVVQLRKVHQARWTTRRTSHLHIAARGVAQARVQAVGPAGRSPWRAGAR